MNNALNDIRTKLRPGLIQSFRNKINNVNLTDTERLVACAAFNQEFNYYLEEEAEISESYKESDIMNLLSPLTNISTLQNGSLKATIPLYFTPSGCFFAHGPDSLLNAANLACQLLNENEEITGIPEVHWPGVTFEQLEVGVCLRGEGISNDFPPYPECHMIGCFNTSGGRIIDFYAKPIKNLLINEWRTFNPLVKDMLFPVNRLPSSTGNGWIYNLNAAKTKDDLTFHQANIMSAHLILDLVGAVSPWFELDRPYKFLSRKLKNVSVFSLETLLRGGQLHIEYFPEQIIGSKKAGFFRLPYKYYFSAAQSDKWSVGELAFTAFSLPELLSVI